MLVTLTQQVPVCPNTEIIPMFFTGKYSQEQR